MSGETILQFDFKYNGPWGDEMSVALADLARDIASEPGLIWKIWTENQETGEAGGVYLFADKESAQVYQRKHSARLVEWGFSDFHVLVFDVNMPLSAITNIQNN